MLTNIWDRRQSRAEIIDRLVGMGYLRREAEVMLAIAWGEVDGDLQQFDAAGTPLPVPRRYIEDPTTTEIFSEMGIAR